MKSPRSFFWYTKSQRNGIFLLILFLSAVQAVLYFSQVFIDPAQPDIDQEQLKRWRASLDSLQKLREINKEKNKVVFRYNPNYLDDFRAYLLGMSPEEFDRLFEFRGRGKYVNDLAHFQSVTRISDSLLNQISPKLRFPDFPGKSQTGARPTIDRGFKGQKADLNRATEDDLKKVYGVGDVLAKRIKAYQSRLQGFSVSEQLHEVYNLPDETVLRILEHFEINEKPQIEKLNVNEASFKELLALPYIDYALTRRILRYRDREKLIADLQELKSIDSFPSEKFDLISLYLTTE